jgi:predicted  nucleic acid-binding Zn-ribbon protein
MPPDIFEGIMAATVLITIGSFVLAGLRMRYQYKSKTLENPRVREEIERLTEAVDGLYERTNSLHEEVAELHEQLDFHERLLAKPRDDAS